MTTFVPFTQRLCRYKHLSGLSLPVVVVSVCWFHLFKHCPLIHILIFFNIRKYLEM